MRTLNKIATFISTFIIVVLATLSLTACGGKANVEPPTLVGVFQNVNGDVMAKIGGLQGDNLNADFTLDGTTWCNVQQDGEFAVLIRYDDGRFTYRETNGTEHSGEIQVGQDVRIGVRTSETATANPSAISNLISVTLKEIQLQPDLQFESNAVGSSEFYGDRETYDTLKNSDSAHSYVAFSQAEGKYFLMKKSYSEFDSNAGAWTCSFVKDYQSYEYEYCVISNVDYPMENRQINVENAINDGVITFNNLSDGFSLQEGDFRLSDDSSYSGIKSALVVLRKCGSSSKLASQTVIIEIFETVD